MKELDERVRILLVPCARLTMHHLFDLRVNRVHIFPKTNVEYFFGSSIIPSYSRRYILFLLPAKCRMWSGIRAGRPDSPGGSMKAKACAACILSFFLLFSTFCLAQTQITT